MDRVRLTRAACQNNNYFPTPQTAYPYRVAGTIQNAYGSWLRPDVDARGYVYPVGPMDCRVDQQQEGQVGTDGAFERSTSISSCPKDAGQTSPCAGKAASFQPHAVNQNPASQYRSDRPKAYSSEASRPIQRLFPIRRTDTKTTMDVRYDTMNGVLGSSPPMPIRQSSSPGPTGFLEPGLNYATAVQFPANFDGMDNCGYSQNPKWQTRELDKYARHDMFQERPSMFSCSCRRRKVCRYFCACLKRIPRRLIRLFQWCFYGEYRQRTICWGCCDLYSVVIALLVVGIIVGDHIHTSTHCVSVQYTSDYLCSERYMSFQCNFPNRDILDDEELLSRCGIQGEPPPIKQHANNTIETTCGSTKLVRMSHKMRRYGTSKNEPTVYKVPNVVHYTIDCNESARFDYISYLSFVSVQRFVAPDKIYVHTNCDLNTTWWQKTITDVTNIYVVPREFPEYIQTRPARRKRDRSDVIKLQTLYHNGGIHLDLDVLIVRSLTRLRTYGFVVGRQEDSGRLGDGVLLAKPHHPSLCLWVNAFRQYDPSWSWQQDAFTTRHLERIVEKYPEDMYLVKNALLKPGPNRIKKEFYEGNYNWKVNFAVKLWRDVVDVAMPVGPEEVDEMPPNFGDLLRYVAEEPPTVSPTPTPVVVKEKKKKKPVKKSKSKKSHTYP